MNYDLAIFDMDGTLVDSLPFFVAIQDELADRHGFRRIAAEHLQALRNATPRQLMKHVGLPKWKLPFVARSFTALMKAHIERVAPFAGVAGVLKALDERGVALALVTSNSVENARLALGEETYARFRATDGGASIFGKLPRIRRVLRHCGVAPARAIYVGDQSSDGDAATRAGVAFGAVAWGYGTLDSMRHCAPREIFHEVADLMRIAG
jgi:phosphoglycolate phosphatase